jgi:hypothetical protein
MAIHLATGALENGGTTHRALVLALLDVLRAHVPTTIAEERPVARALAALERWCAGPAFASDAAALRRHSADCVEAAECARDRSRRDRGFRGSPNDYIGRPYGAVSMALHFAADAAISDFKSVMVALADTGMRYVFADAIRRRMPEPPQQLDDTNPAKLRRAAGLPDPLV